jgi:hypothetical protein
LTVIFRGDMMLGARRTARPLLAGAVIQDRDGGDRLVADAGERRGGGGPRRASPTLRQRAGPPPPAARVPQPQPPTAAAPHVQRFPHEPRAHARARLGPDGPARRRRAI